VLPTFDLLDLQPTDDPLRFRLASSKQLCTPVPGDVVDLEVGLAAHGRATTQAQVVASVYRAHFLHNARQDDLS
jgi:hypothetical protein